jgi:hypothetical protein
VAFRFATGFFALSLTLPPASLTAEWIDVPFVEQRENGCGAAATAMLMRYWSEQGFGPPSEAADPDKIYDRLYSAPARGILGSRIERYLQGHGFQPYVFAGRWDDLSWHIARGRPLLVCVRGGGRDAPLHYLVVTGLDTQQGLVFVNDSARRDLNRINRESFEQHWKAAGNWTLLALPAQR